MSYLYSEKVRLNMSTYPLTLHFFDKRRNMRELIAAAFSIWCVIFLVFDVHSQDNNYVTSQYTITDGLPHNRVSSLAFDKQGFLWLSTSNGLFRFDSYKFEEQAQTGKGTKIINSPLIESLLIDTKGNIWAGYYVGGILKYDPKTQSTVDYLPNDNDSNTICGGRIKTICEDKNGNIWIGSGSGGVSKLDLKTQKFSHYLGARPNKGWQGGSINEIICLSDSSIWAAGIGGLFKHDKHTDSFKKIKPPKKSTIKANEFACVAEDTLRNCLWIGAWSDSLARLDLHTEEITYRRSKANATPSILLDKQGTLWLGSWGRGIYRYYIDENKFEKHTFEGDKKKQNSVKVILDLLEHSSGEIWVSSYSSGMLSITKSKAFKKVKLPKGRREVHPQSFRYHNNNLFISTNINLLQQTSSGEFRTILCKKTFKVLLPDSNQLWATANRFVGRLQEGEDGEYTLNQIRLFEGSRFVDTRKVSGAVFKDSLLYISSINYPMTIFRVNKDGKYKFIKRLCPKNGVEGHLPTVRVNCMLKDSKENIWVGTIGGLFQIRDTTQMIPVHKFISGGEHLSSDLISEIKEDNRGRLLICTSRGLNVLTPIGDEDYKLTKYNTSNGLPENNVRSCSVDVNGMIWLSTNTNIVRINPENQNVFAFGRKDGINVSSFTGASTIAPDGKMIFGAEGCYIEFDPTKVQVQSKAPTLKISGLSILNNPIKAGEEFHDRVILKNAIDYTEELEITHKEKEFSIELSLLEYQKEKKNFYEYKLVGFDEDWVQLGRQRTISFTNLPPGEYQLQARAITSEGIYVELSKPLSIIVTPPWWKTIWFRTAFILLIIASAIGYYRYRMHAIKEKNKELEHQVQLRTQEIRKQSGEIAAQRDHLAKANSMLQEHQEEIISQRDVLSEQKDKLEDANFLLKERQEEILTQNEEIKQQTEEIASQRDYVQKQNAEIAEGLMSLELLSDFGQKLTSTLRLEDILEMVHDYVSSILKTDAFGVGLYRDTKQRIDYHAFYENGVAQPLFTKAHAPETSFSSWAIQNKKEIFENNIEQNYKLYFKEKPSLSTNFNAKSLLVFPLFSGDKVIGVLSIYSQAENSYAQKNFSFVKNLSAYISIAVTNARLYGEMNRKNENIQSSIAYARNIQKAILPLKRQMDTLVETFTLFLPKDVVSGDFYWHSDISSAETNEALFAVVDCTGHGVPGAFMSLIGNRILNRIVNERKVHEPALILTELHRFIVEALKQDSTDNNDGMDVALCKITKTESGATIAYAGAKRNLIIIEPSGNTNIVKGTRKSIGGTKAQRNKTNFASETFNAPKGTTLYLSSDGYTDQNNISNKKFGSTALLDLLRQIYQEDIEKQSQILKETLQQHMGKYEQRDDITIMGIKI